MRKLAHFQPIVNNLIEDPKRLQALARLGLLDSASEDAFDRLARLAQRLLSAPVALVSLVDGDRQFFKSAVGLSGPIAASRQTPLTHSFCQHVVTTGEVLAVNDAPHHPLVGENLAIRDLGVMSYLGIPLRSPDGFVIGSFCAIDTKVRIWTEVEIEGMRELAELVIDQITSRQASSLRQSAADRLLKIADQIPGVLYQFRLRPDSAPQFTYANEAISQICGVTREEVMSDAGKIFATLHADDYASVVDSIQFAAKTMTPWRHEYRVSLGGGTERWLLGQAALERNPDGSTLFHGFMADITDQKREQIASSRLAAIVEYSDDGIIGKDLNSIVTSWNKGAGKIFGYTADEMVGSSVMRLIPTAQHEEEKILLLAINRGESVEHFETVRQRRDGRLINVSITASPIRDSFGTITGISNLTRDITERKREEAERIQYERKLLDTQKLESLGVLAGGIAHDFNNLLTGILGNACLASLDLPADSPLQDNLENIKRSSERAADLCRQMLAYSGKGRFVVQNISLNKLVEDTTNLLQISISKRAVLRFNLYPSLPSIQVDATQIRQVIMNLVINASEAVGEKSGVICLSTGLTRVDKDYLGGTMLAPELPDGTYVHLEISDTGVGMSLETQAKIFDPFFTTKFTGRGLGLAAVLGIVRSHKGALKFYSEPGRGTTFKLLFPCATGGEEAVIADSAVKLAWRGQGCVLVVDDEESIRSATALMLRRLGFTVALASDGREAVDTFRADPDRYVLVLTDLTMPHMDGHQVFREMRRIKTEVPVILMSGFNEEEAISGFAGKGLAGFLQKPFQFQALSETLQRVLAVASEPA